MYYITYDQFIKLCNIKIPLHPNENKIPSFVGQKQPLNNFIHFYNNMFFLILKKTHFLSLSLQRSSEPGLHIILQLKNVEHMEV